MTDVQELLVEKMARLPPDVQKRVLDLVEALSSALPRGASGPALARFAATIAREDADEMNAVIEDGCEQVDQGGW